MGANKQSVYVLTQSILTSEIKFKNWTLIKKKLADLIFNCDFFYIKKAIKIILYNNFGFIDNLKIIYYFLTGSYLEKIINKKNPDIVHIHTISLYSLPFIYACIRTKKNFLITLHGLVSFSEELNTSEFEKKLERNFLKLINNKELDISVISSGIKERINEFTNNTESKVNVILNGVEIDQNNSLNYVNKAQKVLCVGSINKNKNQIQVINAVKKLNKKSFNIELIIIGEGPYLKRLKKYVSKEGISNVKFVGKIPRKEVMSYYKKASLLVVSSYEEGFGLPIIEAYNYGVPVVIYSDLDAVKDLYNKRTMLKVNDRNTNSLAKGIEKALRYDWNRKFIKNFSKKFTLSKISNEYIELFQKTNNSNVSISDIDSLIF